MTAPTPSPASLQEPSSQAAGAVESPVEKRRSRKVYILWGVALALLLGLGVFCWTFVLPVMETRAVVRIAYGCQPSTSKSKDEIWPNEAVKRLGGKAAAESKLQMYLRLPDWIAPEKYRAKRLLELMRDGFMMKDL